VVVVVAVGGSSCSGDGACTGCTERSVDEDTDLQRGSGATFLRDYQALPH
jgi:hypothetical protein